MYIKIVRHLEDEQGVSSNRGVLEDKVVPSEHHIFECLEAHYVKVTANNIAEFHERTDNIETVRIVTPMPDENYPTGSFEFIQINTIIKEDGDKFVNETLIGRDCTLFIMNNEGKTIDSLVCR